MIYCLYQDSTQVIRSNIPLRFQELPRASPSGIPSGEGVFSTVYPSSGPNMDTVNHVQVEWPLVYFLLLLEEKCQTVFHNQAGS